MNKSLPHKERKHLLIVLPRFPYPLEKGDKLRAFYQLKGLSEQFRITLVCISEVDINATDEALVRRYCEHLHLFKTSYLSRLWHVLRCLVQGLPLQVGYFYSRKAKRFIHRVVTQQQVDHIYCQLIRTAELVKDIHNIPKTIDYMDALSEGVRKRIPKQRPWFRFVFKLEAERLKKYERQIFDYFENRLIISEQDQSRIAHPDRGSMLIIPNGINPDFHEVLPRDESFDFVFVGNMSYPPNVEAVEFILSEILPAFPEKKLLVAGANPSSHVKKLCRNTPQVTLQGWVEDIRMAYVSGKIFLAPMMLGTGMQNKLLEAMALGTPCITTTLANNAIRAELNKEILVGNTKEELIHHCHFLLESPEERLRIASNAKKMIRERFDWVASNQILCELMQKHAEFE